MFSLNVFSSTFSVFPAELLCQRFEIQRAVQIAVAKPEAVSVSWELGMMLQQVEGIVKCEVSRYLGS